MIRAQIPAQINALAQALAPILAQARDQAQAAWRRLSSREQALIALALGLGIALAYATVIWRPLAQQRQAALSQLALANRVLAQAGGAARGRPAPAIATAQAADPTRSAAAAGLSVQSLEPEGEGVRIRLEAAPFAKALAWAAGIDAQGPGRLASVKFEKTSQPGLVNVDLRLTGRRP